MEERQRLWRTYLSGHRLLHFWKQELVLPDCLSSVLQNFREEYKNDNNNAARFMTTPITFFLQQSLFPGGKDRASRDLAASRYVLDRIGQWIRKVHPYSNFQQLLDQRKMSSIHFWKYLIQVLAHTPSVGRSQGLSSSDSNIGVIVLMPFERWVREHIGIVSPSLRILLDTTDTIDSSLLRPSSTDRTAGMDILEWRAVFMKCVYLCTRVNLDSMHFRFEEEWCIIDFFLQAQHRHGNASIQEQSDAFFSDMMDFYTQHVENYPSTTFSILHKKISTLLRVFPHRRTTSTPCTLRTLPSSTTLDDEEDILDRLSLLERPA
jgi:hypothetical protein